MVLALIILGWLIAIADQARRYSAQFEESVRLRFENEELIARLRQEKSLAEEASSAKSRFLAAASHDLRQPVHALSLFVAALRPRVTDQEAARMLDHIDSSVQAMGGLFNGLLDISRLDAGVVEVNAQSFAIQPLLERICRDYAGDAAAKQIELRLRPTTRRRASAIRCWWSASCATSSPTPSRTRTAGACWWAAGGAADRCSSQVWDTGRGIPDRGAGAHIPGVLPGRKSRARPRHAASASASRS